MTHLAVKLRKADPMLSGSEIGRILGISRQQVSKVLKRYRLSKICETCYHHNGQECACREDSDIIHNPTGLATY